MEFSSKLPMLAYIIPYQDFLIAENFGYKINVYYEFYMTNILDDSANHNMLG